MNTIKSPLHSFWWFSTKWLLMNSLWKSSCLCFISYTRIFFVEITEPMLFYFEIPSLINSNILKAILLFENFTHVHGVLITWAPVTTLPIPLLSSCQLSFPKVCSLLPRGYTCYCLFLHGPSTPVCSASPRFHIWRKPSFLRWGSMNPSCFHIRILTDLIFPGDWICSDS